jgi:hypothetical protein
MQVDLNIDGPHSDDYTIEVAQAAREAVRVINHATIFGDGLSMPQTVYAVTGALHETAYEMRQALEQIRVFLDNEHDDGRIATDNDGDPGDAVADFADLGQEAEEAAYALSDALERMQQIASHFYVRDAGESGESGDAE